MPKQYAAISNHLVMSLPQLTQRSVNFSLPASTFHLPAFAPPRSISFHSQQSEEGYDPKHRLCKLREVFHKVVTLYTFKLSIVEGTMLWVPHSVNQVKCWFAFKEY